MPPLLGENHMTDHPCKGMTPAQIAAFEQLAINCLPADGWQSIHALIAKGLVERGPGMQRRDAMGVYTVPSFSVSIPVHYQWCAWCSEQQSGMFAVGDKLRTDPDAAP